MPNGRRWWIVACGLYAALAIVITWPLAMRLTTHLAIGAESSATVPLFNLWTLRWNAERLAEGYRDYWDAPIFHPTPGAFAFSEPQPLTGLLFALLWRVSGSDVLAYNLVLLLALTLNGLTAAWMLRTFRLPPAPALLGGLLAVGLPFIVNELGVLQLTVLWPLALTVGALARFVERPEVGRGLGLGASYGATWMTCGNYALIFTLVLPLVALPLVRPALLRPGAIAAGLAGVGLAAVLTLPLLIPQGRLTDGFTRSPRTIERLSAAPEDYLRLDRRTLGAAHTPWLERESGWPRLYPGSGLLGLVLLGLAARKRWIIALGVGALMAFALSLGLNVRLGEWQPYGQLREVVPGVDRFRSPFRFAILVQLCLLGLAGLGLHYAWRQGRWGRIVALGLVVWSLAETATLPARLASAPEQAPAWARWLAAQPAGAVAVVPFPADGSARAYEGTVVAMLQAFTHKHPLVNGYSGFFPADYLRLRRAMARFPNAETLRLLEQVGTRYVIVTRTWLTPQRERVVNSAGLERIYADDQAVVLRLLPEEFIRCSSIGLMSLQHHHNAPEC